MPQRLVWLNLLNTAAPSASWVRRVRACSASEAHRATALSLSVFGVFKARPAADQAAGC